MATRCYLPSAVAGAAKVSPAFDASWEATGSAVRLILDTEKNEASGAYATKAVATSLNSPAGAVDVLIAQYVSAPLSGSGTISGNIKGQIRAQSSSLTGDLRTQCVIRVVSNDGSSVVGTLVASDGSALASEWATSLTNREVPLGSPVTPSSVGYSDGDRLVVEIGYRKHENATTSRTGTLDLGAVSGASDLPEDESTTTQGAPWVEFADTLTFQSTNRRVSQTVLEPVVAPTSQQARLSQAVIEPVVAPTSQQARVSQVVLEVVYPSANPSTPLGRTWGAIIG